MPLPHIRSSFYGQCMQIDVLVPVTGGSKRFATWYTCDLYTANSMTVYCYWQRFLAILPDVLVYTYYIHRHKSPIFLHVFLAYQVCCFFSGSSCESLGRLQIWREWSALLTSLHRRDVSGGIRTSAAAWAFPQVTKWC